jgi:hypothetical protein
MYGVPCVQISYRDNTVLLGMDTESVLRESRAEKLLDPLGFVTGVGKDCYKKQLRLMTPNIGLLQRRQATILELRKTLTPERIEEYDALFKEVQSLEPDVKTFFEKTPVEKDSYEQLLFSGWPSLAVLNTVPFLLLCLSIFKQFIVPALAVFTPLFMVIAPYFVLRHWYNMQIEPKQYIQICMGMFGFQNLNVQNPRVILQAGLTCFSVGQSIYQPIQNALHLQTIHTQLMEKASAVQRIVRITSRLSKGFPQADKWNNPIADVEFEDVHRTFATFWDHPYRLQFALQFIGDCEVVYRMARTNALAPVEFLSGTKPYLVIENGLDPFLSESKPFTLSLTKTKHHAILTGPNRGGKSSVLRSSLLQVVLAQTFGVAFHTGSMHLRPFDWIATGLRLEDRPGSTSMFESEVEFALEILQRAKQNPHTIGFVLFDELFHSTNPPDGARTADLFLQKLWLTKNTASFISTHVFDLAKKAKTHIQKLCVPAYKKKDGTLTFTYALQKGVCEVSSVDLILKEKGFMDA